MFWTRCSPMTAALPGCLPITADYSRRSMHSRHSAHLEHFVADLLPAPLQIHAVALDGHHGGVEAAAEGRVADALAHHVAACGRAGQTRAAGAAAAGESRRFRRFSSARGHQAEGRRGGGHSLTFLDHCLHQLRRGVSCVAAAEMAHLGDCGAGTWAGAGKAVNGGHAAR